MHFANGLFTENTVETKGKPKLFCFVFLFLGSGPVWYMCLKTENCCLKIFVEKRVGEKVY